VPTGIRSAVNGAGPGVRAGAGGQNARREYLVRYNNGRAQTNSGNAAGFQAADEAFNIPEKYLP